MGGSSHHTMLLNQIKNFVLTDDVDVKLLTTTLQRQVHNCIVQCTLYLCMNTVVTVLVQGIMALWLLNNYCINNNYCIIIIIV